MKILSFFIIILLTISSCTVQKRHYSKGYEISFNRSINRSDKKDTELAPKQNKSTIEEHSKVSDQPIDLIASNTKTLPEKVITKHKKILNLPTDSCDVINLRNGETVNAKVLEINKNEIKYKRCDNINGPLIIIDKNNAKSITYKNGYTEEFTFIEKTEKPKNNPDFEKSKRKSYSNDFDGYSIASLVCGVLGIFIFFPAIPAIVCGVIALRNIRESDGELQGRAMATIGIVLGAIIVAIFLLVLLILLATI